VGKRQEIGQSIEDHFKNFTLVPDEIVINLVKKEIEAIQKENKSFILSGFPRTRAQGLAMQKSGIFPDAFLIINVDKDKM
jgi:adenylate kinase